MVNPVHVNPTSADRRLSVGASDWLWVVTAIMGISTLLALAWSKFVGLFPFDLTCFSQGPSTRSNCAEHERSIIWP